jgi:FKBP-type peptidyl-prolyl cis-trans isomerase (trigger factor)
MSTAKETHSHKHFDNLKVERLAESQATITGELTLDVLNEARPRALKALNESVKIDGFRAGSIPENILVKHVGEMRVLEEVAEVALGREYGNILHETKLSPIGRPQVAITKLAPGIPLEFKITVTLEPEFDLPDYKKIAKETAGAKEDLEVKDDEIDAVIKEIEKQNWKPDLKEGEDLREKVKENLMLEKKHRAKEMKRLIIMENLVKEAKVEIPKIMVDSELDRMLAQFKDDVTRHGMKWEEYIKSINKSEEDIRSEWKEKAESRVKAEMVLMKIAETEKLEPTTEELEKETEHLLSHHKDAEPMRVRLYVYQMLKNQKVFEFLETLA